MDKSPPRRVNTRTGLNSYAYHLDHIAGRMGEDDSLIILPHPQGWQIEYYIGQRKIIKKSRLPGGNLKISGTPPSGAEKTGREGKVCLINLENLIHRMR